MKISKNGPYGENWAEMVKDSKKFREKKQSKTVNKSQMGQYSQNQSKNYEKKKSTTLKKTPIKESQKRSKMVKMVKNSQTWSKTIKNFKKSQQLSKT